MDLLEAFTNLPEMVVSEEVYEFGIDQITSEMLDIDYEEYLEAFVWDTNMYNLIRFHANRAAAFVGRDWCDTMLRKASVMHRKVYVRIYGPRLPHPLWSPGDPF